MTHFGSHWFSGWWQVIFYSDDNCGARILSFLTFRHTIAFISIFRFYCILLCLIPVILYLLRTGRERVLLIGSGCIWIAMQVVIVGMHVGTTQSGLASVLLQVACWQPLYVLGGMIGYRRSISAPSLLSKFSIWLPVAVGISLILFVLRQFPSTTPELTSLLTSHTWLIEKITLGPLRFVNFLVLLTLISSVATTFASKIENLPLYFQFGYLARQSIYVFAWSLITTYLGFAFSYRWAAMGAPKQNACALLAVLSLWAAAALSKWYRDLLSEPVRKALVQTFVAARSIHHGEFERGAWSKIDTPRTSGAHLSEA
jgi:hypothetical protein